MKRNTKVVLLFALLFAICGCRGVREIVREVPMHDTLFSEHWLVDTTYIDRWHTVESKGDTVWHTDSVIVYKAKYICDTVREVQEVPVEVVRTETVYVERELTWWQKCRMSVGDIVLWAALLALVGWIVKERLLKR